MQRLAPAAIAMIVALAAPALANSPAANLPSAIMVEWTIANCPADGIPAMLVAMSGMVIQSAPIEEAESIRQAMREGVKANYPDLAAACADMVSRMPG